MTRQSQRPERSVKGDHIVQYDETHPAYGVIGASRVSAGGEGANLFGSDFRHNGYVVVRIGEAELRRTTLSDDHVSGTRLPIVEVALSEAQWATFVSSMNIGVGVPCTIQSSRDGEYVAVPRIERVEDSAGRYGVEVNDKLQEAIAALDEAIADARTKPQRERLERARRKLNDSLPWVLKQYREHGEDTVEKGKMELNAYATRVLAEVGGAALGSRAFPLQLDDVVVEDIKPGTPEWDESEAALERQREEGG